MQHPYPHPYPKGADARRRATLKRLDRQIEFARAVVAKAEQRLQSLLADRRHIAGTTAATEAP